MTQATEEKQTQAVARTGGLGELQKLLETHKTQIAMALPRHLTPERMIRVAMTAYSTTPALHECSSLSIAACVVQSSILGLEINPVLGEAYLVPFWNSKTKKKEAQLIPGYLGLVKLVRQSGELSTIDMHPVYEKDEFDYAYGLNPYLIHKPSRDKDRGEITDYWAAAKLKDGGPHFVVMTVAEVEDHRDKYSAGWKVQGEKSTWGKEFDAMAMKTCIRKLCKLLPKSVELQAALNLMDRSDSGLAQRFTTEVPLALHSPVDDNGDGEPEKEPIQQPKRASEVAKEAGTAAKIADQPAEEEDAIAVQKANIKRKLLAAPVVDELPDCMEIPIGDIRKYKGKFWTPNQDKSGWAQYPVPEGVTL